MEPPNQPPYDVYVVGLGILGHQQVTGEVKSALTRCQEIFVVHYEPSWIEHFSSFCPRVTNLGTLYEPGASRGRIYEEMAGRVLEAACVNPPVALALYGHPLVFVSPTQIILRCSAERGLRTKVLPGISAMDCLFVDLGLDPAAEGLQMYDATDLLLRRRPLQPDVPCLIWQIGSVGSVVHSEAPADPQHLRRLRDYLLGFYPHAHEVVVAASPITPIAKPRLIKGALGRLEEMHGEIGTRETLYVPPLTRREVQDAEFLRLVAPEDGPRPEARQAQRVDHGFPPTPGS